MLHDVGTLEPAVPPARGVAELLPELRAKLPMYGGYAVCRDFAAVLLEKIFEKKPRYVLELGSGLSTLLVAYALEKIGQGRLVSVEHSRFFRALTLRNVRKHGLERRVTVAHCPLKRVILGGGQWQWYDISKSVLAERVDFLIIDGPPGRLQKLSRYPALPLLRAHLAERATIMLDDAHCPDEQEMLALWQKNYPFRTAQVLPTKKGCAILTF